MKFIAALLIQREKWKNHTEKCQRILRISNVKFKSIFVCVNLCASEVFPTISYFQRNVSDDRMDEKRTCFFLLFFYLCLFFVGILDFPNSEIVRVVQVSGTMCDVHRQKLPHF